jgi:hypothetical protein
MNRYNPGIETDFHTAASIINITVTPNQPISGIPVDADVICLLGFMYEEEPDPIVSLADNKLVRITSIDSVLSLICGDISNVSALEKTRESSLFQAIVSTWQTGGKNLTFYSLGKTWELDNCTTEDAKMQLIYERLAGALPIVMGDGRVSIVVPIDAIAEGYTKEDNSLIDFMALCAEESASAMTYGNFIQCFVSTGVSDVTTLLNSESIRSKEDWQFRDPAKSYCYSPSLGWIPGNDMYRFVAVPAGRALFSYPEFGVSFVGGFAPALAGLTSSLGSDISITGRVIQSVHLIEPVSGTHADSLSNAGFIPLGESASARRHKTNSATILADQTMAIQASDFQQEVILRFTRRVARKLRLVLERYIGTNGVGIEDALKETLSLIVKEGLMKSYRYRMTRDLNSLDRIKIFVELDPYLPVKVISIDLSAGPFSS